MFLSDFSVAPPNKRISIINSTDLQTVHIATISYGTKYVNYSLRLMKNILLLSKASSIMWHVFTTDDSVRRMNHKISFWPLEYSKRICVKQASLVCDQWLMYHGVKAEELIGHKIKACMMYGWEYTSIKNFTDHIIYIDLDVIVIDDILNMWRLFDNFGTKHIMSLSRADYRYVHHPNFTETHDGLFGLNAGVIMIHLKHLSRVDFAERYLSCSKEDVYPDGIHNTDDQDVLNVYFSKYPDQILPLGCNWNYRLMMEWCSTLNIHACIEGQKQGLSLLHAARLILLTESHFTPVYNCVLDIDLRHTSNTMECLKEAVHQFKTARYNLCQKQEYFLRPVEIVLGI